MIPEGSHVCATCRDHRDAPSKNPEPGSFWKDNSLSSTSCGSDNLVTYGLPTSIEFVNPRKILSSLRIESDCSEVASVKTGRHLSNTEVFSFNLKNAGVELPLATFLAAVASLCDPSRGSSYAVTQCGHPNRCEAPIFSCKYFITTTVVAQ
ncbi:hypothetical protein IV203_009713 [Nitzschia inconspicua]|uniref:Uncharacterized protein n=1 Tax=Nitzschia inconspicua TaxID=303405 RepID=A0A9K3PKA6_9STRA|nr:hypothetical protein IV203_009713 [Nitzschia inconspicua]